MEAITGNYVSNYKKISSLLCIKNNGCCCLLDIIVLAKRKQTKLKGSKVSIERERHLIETVSTREAVSVNVNDTNRTSGAN